MEEPFIEGSKARVEDGLIWMHCAFSLLSFSSGSSDRITSRADEKRSPAGVWFCFPAIIMMILLLSIVPLTSVRASVILCRGAGSAVLLETGWMEGGVPSVVMRAYVMRKRHNQSHPAKPSAV